jgi:hypothetical protein
MRTLTTTEIDGLFQNKDNWINFQNAVAETIRVVDFDFGEGLSKWIDFRFLREVHFIKCTFGNGALVNGGQFQKVIKFVECEFRGTFDIRNVTANSSCLAFEQCSFLGAVNINLSAIQRLELNSDFDSSLSVTISGLSRPDDFVGTSSAPRRFKGDTLFVGTFAFLQLPSSRFEGKLKLDNIACYESANFSASTFLDSVSALRANLIKGGNFQACTFHGDVSFKDMTVDGELSLASIMCEKNFDLSAAKETPLREIGLDSSVFCGGFDLSNRSMTRRTSFWKTEFRQPPSFHNAKLFPNTIFLDAQFPKHFPADRKLASESEAAYRSLRVACKTIEAHGDEQYFFAMEMRARRVAQDKAQLRALYAAYQTLSNYGQSVYRPLGWFLCVLLLSYLGFAAIQASVTKLAADKCECRLVFDASAALDIAGLTAAQAIPFVPIFKDWPANKTGILIKQSPAGTVAVYAWSVFTAIASILMLFFVGLGLRNQFRLKSS